MPAASKLQISTPSEREIFFTRVFDAPREVVWEAMNKPELVKRWLHGPPGWTMVECENDLRVGGRFRWVWRGSSPPCDAPSGAAPPQEMVEMTITGVNMELKRPERLVHTEKFEFGGQVQEGEQVCTLVLTEQNGRTTMSLTVVYQSKEARDQAVASGMERGMEASYVQLDELLPTLPA